jgi:hypothetical protein
MWLNNYEAQLVPGGLHTLPHYVLITTSHGVSSTMPSMLTTYLRVCSIAS